LSSIFEAFAPSFFMLPGQAKARNQVKDRRSKLKELSQSTPFSFELSASGFQLQAFSFHATPKMRFFQRNHITISPMTELSD
jgi:hypothetical protein